MKTSIKILVLNLVLATLGSCEKEKDDENSGDIGNILVTTMLPNPDGWSGSSYMQLMDNLDAKAITNTTALPIPYSCVPCIDGDDIFVVPGWGTDTDVMTKYSRIDGQLVKKGEYTLPSQSGATNVVIKGDIAYIACALIGKVIVLNHKTMQLVKEIDVASYGIGDQNPDPSSMLIRDNFLYVGLIQMVGGYFPAPGRPYSDVILIDTEQNQVVKMITDSTSGISYPTRAIDPYSIFMDENNNIYVIGLGGFGAMRGHNSGVLRIKSGETEFDDDYQFIFNTTTIDGEDNYLDYVHAVKYYGNGILYGTANIPAYYGNPLNYIEDRTVIPVEIDLHAKIIKKLDFPYSNSFGVSVGIFDGQVVFGLATTSSNGFYTYNPATGEASSTAVVTTEGYPYSFVAFE